MLMFAHFLNGVGCERLTCMQNASLFKPILPLYAPVEFESLCTRVCRKSLKYNYYYFGGKLDAENNYKLIIASGRMHIHMYVHVRWSVANHNRYASLPVQNSNPYMQGLAGAKCPGPLYQRFHYFF